MSRKKQKKKEISIQYKNTNFSREEMIEIQEEAYYRAMKKIDAEKNESPQLTIYQNKSSERKKYKWYENVLFIINVCFFPWKICKKFEISNRIGESTLVLFVALILGLGGGLIWLYGIYLIVLLIHKVYESGITGNGITVFPLIMVVLFLGSLLTLAGQEFSKETDSNKIYAFSACVLALTSCITGIITIIYTYENISILKVFSSYLRG